MLDGSSGGNPRRFANLPETFRRELEDRIAVLKARVDLFYNHNSIVHTSLSGSWKRPEHNDWSYIDSILRLCSKGTGRPVQQPQWYCPHESTQELSKKNSIRFVHGI